MTKKRLLIVLAGACAVALAAAGVAAGVFRNAGSASSAPDIHSSLGRRMTVARFDPQAGDPDRQVVLERTPDGYVCLWDSPDGTAEHGLGGCNTASDPLGGRALFASLTYDGGPDVGTVRDPRLSGLTLPTVDHVLVVMSDGSTRKVHLSHVSTRAVAGADYASFAYRIPEGDVHRGVTPVAVVAADAAGHELDRQTTGIGG